jgi:hypothetical protein
MKTFEAAHCAIRYQGEASRQDVYWPASLRLPRGYNFTAGGLTLAESTLATFVMRRNRLYEQERRRPEGHSPLGAFAMRFVGLGRAADWPGPTGISCWGGLRVGSGKW